MSDFKHSPIQIPSSFQCNCNTKKLQDKIQDLTLKYEALEEKYKTTKLERIECEKRIYELEQDKEEQRISIQIHKRQLTEEILPIAPMMQLRMKDMASEISENDEIIQELQLKLTQFSDTVADLRSENSTIRQENLNYRKSLLLNDKQKKGLQTALIANKKEIHALNIEIERSQDEINALNSQTLEPINESNNSTPSCYIDKDNNQGDTLRLHFMKTPEEYDADISQFYPFKFAALMGFTDSNSELLSPVDENNKYNIEIIRKMKLKLEQLDSENKQLLMRMEASDTHDDMKYVQECQKDNVNAIDEEFDENDMDEMEDLFRKCEEKINEEKLERNQSIKSRIERAIQWWICYENIVCGVNIAMSD